ncbi:peptide deformylase [Sulfurimonas gotlandica GD1]|uniref:Peptide deformylase n=1 Tax=Sulfurimonas gotlandica (strain DSM 19862 / JCM 16533 / GD1) TaxID=929558 RepID=B6BJ91_SULGG|nr:peptide deformylase [Sulfurimonas gotlandica]EDZ63161.1 formylmethionine deformylase [Sulfurimonas gotlandica GD1]EHP30609.1 peptide deformylase [Sulfurimonas gotlandica GD1]
MVRDIITYPTPPSVEYGTDVRVFNEEIISIIQDLKDTIEANSLEALAAFQIGAMYNIIVIKKGDMSFVAGDDGFLELINPRIISCSEKISTVEKTAYFPGLSANVERHNNVSIIYEDKNFKQHNLKATGGEAILLQRKIDYTFGSSFINKLSKDEKKLFEKKLEFGSDIAISESCPTTFKRDYILKAINTMMIAMALLIVASLFVSVESTQESMWSYQLYASYGVLGLSLIYFFYAQYEGKQFTSCTSCQIGNIIGTTVITLIKLTLIMLISFFIVNP